MAEWKRKSEQPLTDMEEYRRIIEALQIKLAAALVVAETQAEELIKLEDALEVAARENHAQAEELREWWAASPATNPYELLQLLIKQSAVVDAAKAHRIAADVELFTTWDALTDALDVLTTDTGE